VRRKRHRLRIGVAGEVRGADEHGSGERRGTRDRFLNR
jgi:hypothetical protein